MVNWKDIHKDFAKKPSWSDKTYQYHWEQNDLTYQDAREWVAIGFKSRDYYQVSQWKNLNFTPQRTKAWINSGLKEDGYKNASYLKQNNITPEQYVHYKENQTPQEQLDYFFANKDQIKTIDLHNLNFNQPSKLIVADYPNLKKIYGRYIPNLTQLTITNCSQLKEIDIDFFKNLQQLILHNLPSLKILNCSYNKLTTLDLSDFVNLEEINCSNNQLTRFKLPEGEKLRELNLSHNNLNQNLSFLSSLVNLQELDLNNNPLYGSLDFLKDLSELWTLNIADTDINSGLEYLPDSSKYFECSADKEGAKCKFIEQELEPYGGTIQGWRQARKRDQQIQLLQSENQKINFLENEIARLTNLIKQQKEKIINAYLHFFTEKELLKELINSYLEYSKARKQNLPAFRFRKQYDKLYYELAEKIGEAQMEAVEKMLKDCEELIHYEAELQEQINNNQSLIETSQKAITNITYHINEINVNSGHAMIGNSTGDKADLSCRIEEILETKILMPSEQSASITTRDKRSLSVSSTTETQEENKIAKLDEEQTTKIQQKEPYGIPGSSKNN